MGNSAARLWIGSAQDPLRARMGSPSGALAVGSLATGSGATSLTLRALMGRRKPPALGVNDEEASGGRRIARGSAKGESALPKLVAPLQGVTEESHVDGLGRNDADGADVELAKSEEAALLLFEPAPLYTTLIPAEWTEPAS